MDISKVPENTRKKKSRSIKQGRKWSKIISYLLLIILSVVFLFPFLWLVFTAVKPEREVLTFPPRMFPSVWKWSNYPEVFKLIDFGQYYLNSIFVSLIGVFGTVLSSTLVAFGFARLKGAGHGIWFALLLATMMLPSQVTMIPVYLIYSKLKLVNTFVPLTLGAFFGSAYYIFLQRQFFLTIPKSLEESARLDGANTFQIFAKIMLPLSVPSVITVALLTFMGFWNDFMNPLIYLNDQSKYTLALGIMQLQGSHVVAWGPLMAASVMVIVPVIITFFVGQKYFIQGIATTGSKE
ncbi:carbohydrate ABC transporter permease [Lapidilactobacillus achengensis]|uniref:Carbohydrate ABC transporter permease n=1 Tax=Lapidilactobacillus achengensis TaxID=2486000 RepID=A0ABW1US82_9LACO|nr:carbohydrate ABC transporter permease [Lapidilactobacillus achengensis]